MRMAIWRCPGLQNVMHCPPMGPAALPAGLGFRAPEFLFQPVNSCEAPAASVTVANRHSTDMKALQPALGQPFGSLATSSPPATPRSLLQPSQDYLVCFTPSDCSSAASGEKSVPNSMADGPLPSHLLQHGPEQLLATGPGPSIAVGAGWAKPKCREAHLVASDMEPTLVAQEVMSPVLPELLQGALILEQLCMSSRCGTNAFFHHSNGRSILCCKTYNAGASDFAVFPTILWLSVRTLISCKACLAAGSSK